MSAPEQHLDDDATPSLTITNQSQPEGNAGTSTMTFTVNLSAISGRDVSFSRATVDGTATAGSDYVALAPQTLSAAIAAHRLLPLISARQSFAFSAKVTGAMPACASACGAGMRRP